MDIKPASQKKKLVYPLAAAAVVGSAVLSSCDPQPLGGLIGPKKSLPSEKKSPQALGGVISPDMLELVKGVFMLEPAKGATPVKADK